jgi:hypothetical protein
MKASSPAPASTRTGPNFTSGRHQPADVRIVVCPAVDRSGRRRPEQFEVRFWGRPEVLCVSRQPILDVARILISQGKPPQTAVALAHASDPTRIALRATIGIAARFDVMSTRFARRKVDLELMPRQQRGSTILTPPDCPAPSKTHRRARHKREPAQAPGARTTSAPDAAASECLAGH